MKKILIAFVVLTLFTGFALAEDGAIVVDWHGFNVSGEGDFGTPGNPTATLYDTYRDMTGTYTDVLKLTPPPGGYKPGSIAMTYTVPIDGNYRLSMWVWVDKPQDQIVYIEFPHTGGEWESVTGSINEPAAFRKGQWLYVTTDSSKYPDGVFLREGDIFGLLTQSGEGDPGIGLNDCTIFLRDLQLEATTADDSFTPDDRMPSKAFLSFLSGLYVGAEFGIDNINEANDGKREPFLYPTLGYGNSFFDDAMYFYLELKLKTGFYDVENEDGKSTYPVGLYLDSSLDYSLFFGSSTLTFILEDTIDPPLVINPRFNSGNLNMYNKFTPGLKFNQWVEGVGNLYAQIGFPIYYSYYWHDDTDTVVYFQGKLGWYSEFGLGIWVREDWILAGDKGNWAEPGHQSINFGLTYLTRLFDTSLEVNILRQKYGDISITSETNIASFFNFKVEASLPQKDIKSNGINLTLTPLFRYSIFDGFSVWAKCVIENIGRKGYDAVFSPSIGVTYYF